MASMVRTSTWVKLFLIFGLWSGYNTVEAVTKKPWTFLVYLAAANSLSDYAASDIAEMMKVGSNQNVNVLVYLTMFNKKGIKSTRFLYVEKGKVTQIGATTVEDSGSVITLKKAFELVFTQYPADHYCIDLWNHGGGILNRSGECTLRGVCYDDNTGNYLTDRDCLDAFTYAKRNLNAGKNIDIVAIDACLMNMLEYAYTLSSCVDFFVGSETTIPGDGFEYARILNSFVRGVPNPRIFAQNIVQVYQETYTGTPDYTLSALDESLLAPVVDNFNLIIKALSATLTTARAKTVRKYVAMSCNAAPWFNDRSYVDLLSVYRNLLNYVPKMGLSKQAAAALQTLLKNGQQLIGRVVIGLVASSSYKNVGGISVYWPQQYIDASYYDLYWTEKNPAMLNFLKLYLK